MKIQDTLLKPKFGEQVMIIRCDNDTEADALMRMVAEYNDPSNTPASPPLPTVGDAREKAADGDAGYIRSLCIELSLIVRGDPRSPEIYLTDAADVADEWCRSDLTMSWKCGMNGGRAFANVHCDEWDTPLTGACATTPALALTAAVCEAELERREKAED